MRRPSEMGLALQAPPVNPGQEKAQKVLLILYHKQGGNQASTVTTSPKPEDCKDPTAIAWPFHVLTLFLSAAGLSRLLLICWWRRFDLG